MSLYVIILPTCMIVKSESDLKPSGSDQPRIVVLRS